MTSQTKRHLSEVWEGLSTSFVPVNSECIKPPSMWMCSPTWKLPQLHTFEIFLWRLHHVGTTDYLIPFPALSPFFKKIGGRDENSKLLILAWSFQLGHPGAIQIPPRVSALETKHSHLQGNYKSLGELRARSQGERPICFCYLTLGAQTQWERPGWGVRTQGAVMLALLLTQQAIFSEVLNHPEACFLFYKMGAVMPALQHFSRLFWDSYK